MPTPEIPRRMIEVVFDRGRFLAMMWVWRAGVDEDTEVRWRLGDMPNYFTDSKDSWWAKDPVRAYRKARRYMDRRIEEDKEDAIRASFHQDSGAAYRETFNGEDPRATKG